MQRRLVAQKATFKKIQILNYLALSNNMNITKKHIFWREFREHLQRKRENGEIASKTFASIHFFLS